MSIKKYLAPVFALVIFTSVWAQPALRISVSELELRNDIGLENGGVVVSELLVSSLKTFNVYKINERILLHKVLEEQQLQLAVSDDGQASTFAGNIDGINAIVAGSIMRLGDTISLRGRLVEVTTGKVLKQATVDFKDIKEIETRAEELAFYLCGHTKEEYGAFIERRSLDRIRLGAGIASGYAFSNTDYANIGDLAYGFEANYKSAPIDVDWSFIFDFATSGYWAQHTELTLYPWKNLGISLLSTINNDCISSTAHLDGRIAGPFVYLPNAAPMFTFYLGSIARLTPWMRLGAWYGASVAGQYTVASGNTALADYAVNSFKYASGIPLNFAAEGDFILGDSWTLRLFWYLASGDAGIVKDYSGSSPSRLGYSFQNLQLSLGYSFGL